MKVSGTVVWGVCALLAGVMSAEASGQDLFEDFEGIANTSVGSEIVLGETGKQVTLSGADQFAGVIGVGSLYHSGVRAWMGNAGGTSVMTFDLPADAVSFYATQRSGANGDSVVRAFDANNQMIGAAEVLTAGGGFRQLNFGGGVSRIEIENLATSANGMNSIDDLSYSAIPEPGMAGLVGAVMLFAGVRRGRRRVM